MALKPGDIGWRVTAEAHADLAADRQAWGEPGYDEQKNALKLLLCSYFAASRGCTEPMHKSIAPVAATSDGGKILKVRWTRPGQGKRGGFRCVFVAYCEDRRVVLCRALVRSSEPSLDDVREAAELAPNT